MTKNLPPHSDGILEEQIKELIAARDAAQTEYEQLVNERDSLKSEVAVQEHTLSELSVLIARRRKLLDELAPDYDEVKAALDDCSAKKESLIDKVRNFLYDVKEDNGECLR